MRRLGVKGRRKEATDFTEEDSNAEEQRKQRRQRIQFLS
jgi:hypothetical protein